MGRPTRIFEYMLDAYAVSFFLFVVTPIV
jgi:hypothetical protein